MRRWSTPLAPDRTISGRRTGPGRASCRFAPAWASCACCLLSRDELTPLDLVRLDLDEGAEQRGVVVLAAWVHDDGPPDARRSAPLVDVPVQAEHGLVFGDRLGDRRG